MLPILVEKHVLPILRETPPESAPRRATAVRGRIAGSKNAHEARSCAAWSSQASANAPPGSVKRAPAARAPKALGAAPRTTSPVMCGGFWLKS